MRSIMIINHRVTSTRWSMFLTVILMVGGALALAASNQVRRGWSPSAEAQESSAGHLHDEAGHDHAEEGKPDGDAGHKHAEEGHVHDEAEHDHGGGAAGGEAARDHEAASEETGAEHSHAEPATGTEEVAHEHEEAAESAAGDPGHGEKGHVHSEAEGHVHAEEDEAHAHAETEGEQGVVEVPEEFRTPLGIKVEPARKGELAITLDLYGWVRPRPSDVTELRAPVPALVSEIHVQQGQMVEEGQSLVTLVVPSSLDWQKTILASFNEKSQLRAAHDLLLAEGESKVVQLLGEIRVAAAEKERLSDEVALLEQAGSEAIARRDVNVKRGELKSAVAMLDAKRALALAYGLAPEFTKRIEGGEIGIQVPQGALPPEIRRQLRENDFKEIVATNDQQVAIQNLASLGFNHGLAEELSRGNLSRLTDKLVLLADRPGLVTEIRVTRQASLNAAEAILRVIDYRKIYVDAEVAESDISRVLARGSDQMPIRFTGLGDQVIEGHVAFFDTTIHPDVRKAHLVLEVENQKGLPLREHMAASVIVPLEIREEILSVPRPSLVTDSFQKVVFVEEGGHFHRTAVKTGIETSDSVEIIEGLSAGDPVVISGARVLLLALSAPKGGGDAHAGHNH